METKKWTIAEVDIKMNEAVKNIQDLKTAIQEANKAKDENKANPLSTEYIKASAELKSLNTELRSQENLLSKVITSQNSNLNSLDQLKAQLAVVTKQWSQLSEDERLNSEIGLKLTKQKLELSNALEKEEKATGNASRGVGKYKEGILEAVAELRKQETELKKNIIALDEIASSEKTSEQNKKQATLQLETSRTELVKVNNELKLYGQNLEITDAEIISITNSTDNLENSTKPLKVQLRELTQQLQMMHAQGKENTAEFQELSKKAGVLKDSMNSVNDQVNTLATGSKLEAFVKVGKGAFDAVAGSAQAAEGAMQLMGSENENVTKGIQKMMALQSLSNGVNQVYNSLIKEGALVTGIMTAKTWLQTTAIGAYNLVVGTSTGLMKAFRLALAGTGIGLLVIAIMGAVQAMGLFNDETEDAIKKSEELDNIINKSNQSRNTKISLIEKEIELLNAQGATADEIYKKEKELIELKLFNSRVAIASGLTDEKLTKEVLVREGLKMDLEILNAKNKKRLADENEKLQSENEAKEKKRIEDKIKRDKEIADLEQKRIDNQLRLLNYELELWKLNNKSKLESNQKLSEDLIAQETQRLQIEFEKNLSYQNELLLQDKITAEEYNLFKIENQQNLNETISQLNKDFETQEQARKLESAQTNFDNEMQILEGQTFKILELEKDKLTRQRQQEIEAALESGADIEKIIKKFDKAELELDKAKENAKLSIYANTADQIANIFGETTEIGKIASVASATIQTYLGAQAAFTQTTLVAGPIFGAIAAASAVATGISNVKKILSVDAKGKSTPSIGSSSSSFSSPTQQKSESGAVSTVSDSEIGRGIVSRGVKATDLKNGYSTVLVVDDVTNSQMINKQRVNASTY